MLAFSGVINAGQILCESEPHPGSAFTVQQIMDSISIFMQVLPTEPPPCSTVQIKPLLSKKQQSRIEGYIAESTRLVRGG